MLSLLAKSSLVSTGAFASRGLSRSFATGTVKWFNATKGYGFLTNDDASADIFVHQSNIVSTTFRFLEEGEKVKFDIEKEERGQKAVNVTNLDGSPLERPQKNGGGGGGGGGGGFGGGGGRQGGGGGGRGRSSSA